MTEITLVPAYGRQYLNSAAALQDWKAGKDFKILGGPYCSIRDFKDRDNIYIFLALGIFLVKLK